LEVFAPASMAGLRHKGRSRLVEWNADSSGSANGNGRGTACPVVSYFKFSLYFSQAKLGGVGFAGGQPALDTFAVLTTEFYAKLWLVIYAAEQIRAQRIIATSRIRPWLPCNWFTHGYDTGDAYHCCHEQSFSNRKSGLNRKRISFTAVSQREYKQHEA
jgi:hypothetical protein